MIKYNKYKNVKTELDGIKFDSKAEAKRYIQLRSMLEDGHITDLQFQIRYELTPKLKRADGTTERASHYVADFQYMHHGTMIIEDVKGGTATMTPVYVLKRKLMLEKHGITITEINKK